MAISFDSPQTATARPVGVTGTIPPFATTGYLTILLNVTGTGRNDTFYREVSLPVNPTSTSIGFNATYNLSIVPRLHGANTVTTTWSFSF